MYEQDTLLNREVSLIDILDVILDKGVAIRGDLMISIADIDLVYIDLRILITAVETIMNPQKKLRQRDGDDI